MSFKEIMEGHIAGAWAAIDRCEEKLAALDKKEASSSKEPSTKSAIFDKVNVYYYASAGNKIFLGTVDDATKFAHFSLIARDQLHSGEARSEVNKGNQRKVIVGRVDREAALLVLKYINNNSMYQPEPITDAHVPTDSTFALRCKVHHACNVFRIPRQLCRDDLRDRVCFEIRQLPTVTCADLQLICETAYFDAGLMNIMQNKVAYHTLRGWMSEHELACIWQFVSEHDKVKGSNYVERINAVFEKLQANAAARGSVFSSGWCAEGVTPGQPRGAGQSVVMPTRPKNMAARTARNAAVISTEAAAEDQGARGHSAQVNEPEVEEITFVRPSTAGPPLDLSAAPKNTNTKFTGKARSTSMSNPKTVLKPSNAASSTDADKINWSATGTAPPNKPFGNVGGTISAMKAAPGLGKGKGKLEIAVPEPKEEDKEGESKEEHGKDKGRGKGKENITMTEATPSAGSPSTPGGKMSYAQMLGRGGS